MWSIGFLDKVGALDICIATSDNVLCRSISSVHYFTSARTHTIHYGLSALTCSICFFLSGDDKLFSISSRQGRRVLVGGCFRRSFSAAGAAAAERQQELVWERARPAASASGSRLRLRGGRVLASAAGAAAVATAGIVREAGFGLHATSFRRFCPRDTATTPAPSEFGVSVGNDNISWCYIVSSSSTSSSSSSNLHQQPHHSSYSTDQRSSNELKQSTTRHIRQIVSFELQR